MPPYVDERKTISAFCLSRHPRKRMGLQPCRVVPILLDGMGQSGIREPAFPNGDLAPWNDLAELVGCIQLSRGGTWIHSFLWTASRTLLAKCKATALNSQQAVLKKKESARSTKRSCLMLFSRVVNSMHGSLAQQDIWAYACLVVPL